MSDIVETLYKNNFFQLSDDLVRRCQNTSWIQDKILLLQNADISNWNVKDLDELCHIVMFSNSSASDQLLLKYWNYYNEE